MERRPANRSDVASTQSDRNDDFRVAFQAYVQMVGTEQAKQWSAISIFIPLSLALVVAALSPDYVFGLKETKVAWVVGFILGLVGMMASFIWWGFNNRSQKIQRYWILCAREAEKGLARQVRGFQRGRWFQRGDKVKVAGERIQYAGLERLRARVLLDIIFGFYVFVFVVLAARDVLRFFSGN
jgi:hypothetical protein